MESPTIPVGLEVIISVTPNLSLKRLPILKEKLGIRPELKQILFLILFGTIIYLPSLFNTGLVFDDLAWLWVVKREGYMALLEYLRQSVHIGYWLPISFFYAIGDNLAWIPGRLIGVLCHLFSSLILYILLGRINFLNKVAFYTSAVYLLSPFYYVRGTLIHNIYDVFMFFYLMSVLLSDSKKLHGKVTAVGCLIISLSFETLLFLEPLRIVYIYSLCNKFKQTVRRCAPFWLTIVAFLLIRVFFLAPFGQYDGYNQMTFDFADIAKNLHRHLQYYPRGINFTVYTAAKLFGVPALLTLISAILLIVFKRNRRICSDLENNNHIKEKKSLLYAIVFGVVLSILGAMPYAIANRFPHYLDFDSRIAYVSILGVAIIIGTVIALVPQNFIRETVFYIVILFFGLSSLFISKWYIYDSLIQADLNSQLEKEINVDTGNLPLFHLQYEPNANSILVLNRTLRIFDMNVPINLKRKPEEPPVFFYNDTWPKESENFFCDVTGFSRYPCPEETAHIKYTLKPEFSSVAKVSYWWLIMAVINKHASSLKMGTISSSDGWLVRHEIEKIIKLNPAHMVIGNAKKFLDYTINADFKYIQNQELIDSNLSNDDLLPKDCLLYCEYSTSKDSCKKIERNTKVKALFRTESFILFELSR